MIPQFPNFKKIELSDREEIELITSRFPPYSDFNFVSIWCWDISDSIEISILNNNLVVKFTDYISNEPFLSFIGENNINDTVEKILLYSVDKFNNSTMKLIPESVMSNIDSNLYIIEEDRDNFDYIYDINKLKTYDGNKLRSKRNLSNRFKKRYSADVLHYNSFENPVKDLIRELFKKWSLNKGMNESEYLNELKAIERVLNSPLKNLVIVCLFVDDQLVGFIINEKIDNKNIMLHFEKADESFLGVYAYIMMENSKILSQLGFSILNYEQDLGIPGLRLGKRAYRHEYFLKKYTVRRK